MVDESQELLQYACQCGYKIPDKKTFNQHLLSGSRKDGKGVHKSLGRVNISSGEIVMPPFDERSKDQKAASTYALKKKAGETGGAVRQTEIIADATSVKFVPRVLTASFTPIMLSGMTAAQRVWGWRQDMPFENFLDTIIVNFFRDRGIELAAFVIQDPAQHEQIRQENILMAAGAAAEEKLKEEVPV